MNFEKLSFLVLCLIYNNVTVNSSNVWSNVDETVKGPNTYFINKNLLNWQSAIDACKAKNMHLIEYKKPKEQILISEVIKEHDSSTTSYWTSNTNGWSKKCILLIIGSVQKSKYRSESALDFQTQSADCQFKKQSICYRKNSETEPSLEPSVEEDDYDCDGCDL